MNNILYITYVDYKKGAFPGVQSKIAGQMDAMRAAGFAADRVNQYGKQAQFVEENGKMSLVDGATRRFAILNAVKLALKNKTYVAAFIRFQFFSEDVRQMVSLLHSSGAKVLMEIPTFPYEGELHKQGKKGEVKLFCDRLYRNPCADKIDFFVTQSEDKTIYGVPSIQVLNGLDFSCHPMRKIRQPEKHELHLLAVASMLPWHGYDRMLNGLADYYKKSQDTNIVLHLVGEGRELPGYENIVKEEHIEDHVVFYGMKGGQELDDIASKCDIAVGSLAAFRIGIKKLSTLKSREYCAWGFPTINATPTDILDANDPYALFVPEDESDIDMKNVLDFYRSVYFESEKTPEQIANEIRKNAKQRCDINTAFYPVLEAIRQE